MIHYKTYICQYCNSTLEHITGHQFGTHKINCKNNPKKKKIQEARNLTRAIIAQQNKRKIVPGICESCKKQHDGKYGSGRFCSKHCAHSFTTKAKRQEINKKVSEKLTKKNIQINCKSCAKIINKNKYGYCINCLNKQPFRKIQLSAALKGKSGGARLHGGRSKFQDWYISPIAGKVFLQSSYELWYATFLDKIGIQWVRNTQSFEYTFNNEIRKYTPDFYLPDFEVYIEIKGYETARDRAKWSQFPLRLKVLKGKDLGISTR